MGAREMQAAGRRLSKRLKSAASGLGDSPIAMDVRFVRPSARRGEGESGNWVGRGRAAPVEVLYVDRPRETLAA